MPTSGRPLVEQLPPAVPGRLGRGRGTERRESRRRAVATDGVLAHGLPPAGRAGRVARRVGTSPDDVKFDAIIHVLISGIFGFTIFVTVRTKVPGGPARRRPAASRGRPLGGPPRRRSGRERRIYRADPPARPGAAQGPRRVDVLTPGRANAGGRGTGSDGRRTRRAYFGVDSGLFPGVLACVRRPYA